MFREYLEGLHFIINANDMAIGSFLGLKEAPYRFLLRPLLLEFDFDVVPLPRVDHQAPDFILRILHKNSENQ